MTETKEVNPNLKGFQEAADTSIRFMVVHAITELGLTSDQVLDTLIQIVDELLVLQIESIVEVMKEGINENSGNVIPDTAN